MTNSGKTKSNVKTIKYLVAVLASALGLLSAMAAEPAAAQASAADDAAELAKKLQNPVANLISAPIQNNWDFGIGPEDAMRYTANLQFQFGVKYYAEKPSGGPDWGLRFGVTFLFPK